MMFLKAVSAARRTYPVVTNGLKLYLDAYNTRSYPGTGSTWFDLSNSAYNFTNYGATWTTSGSLRYWELDGVNDRIEGTNTTTIFDVTSAGHTWSMWVNHTTTPSAADVIVNAEYGTTGKISYFLDNRNSTDTNGNGWIFGTYTDTGGQGRFARFNQTITTNVWRHVCGTFTYTTTTTGTFRIYINGTEQVSSAQTVTGGLTWTSFNNSTRPIIGALKELAGTYSRFNNIKVGEVLNYNRPLTATEVSNNYNSTKSNYGL
jgi:hypothetical protein